MTGMEAGPAAGSVSGIQLPDSHGKLFRAAQRGCEQESGDPSTPQDVGADVM